MTDAIAAEARPAPEAVAEAETAHRRTARLPRHPLRPPVSVSCLNYRPVAPGSATRPYLPMTWGWRRVGG
jgi:hypothetical protein